MNILKFTSEEYRNNIMTTFDYTPNYEFTLVLTDHGDIHRMSNDTSVSNAKYTLFFANEVELNFFLSRYTCDVSDLKDIAVKGSKFYIVTIANVKLIGKNYADQIIGSCEE